MPNGSPSSRLPRRPMWPLERANSDSDCASRPSSSWVSLTDHGSTGYGRCTIIAAPPWASGRLRGDEVGEVGDDDVGAVRPQRVRLADAVHPHHVPEAAGPT